jgi:predicted RNA-binding Zn-ribbon protein involved in translation (DUF1610 family)
MTQPDIGERIMPANYDNPIDTNYAHEHAAYERGYQDATTAMAERDAEIAKLQAKLAAVREALADPYHQHFSCPDCGSDEFGAWEGVYTCHNCRWEGDEQQCMSPGGDDLIAAIAETAKES